MTFSSIWFQLRYKDDFLSDAELVPIDQLEYNRKSLDRALRLLDTYNIAKDRFQAGKIIALHGRLQKWLDTIANPPVALPAAAPARSVQGFFFFLLGPTTGFLMQIQVLHTGFHQSLQFLVGWHQIPLECWNISIPMCTFAGYASCYASPISTHFYLKNPCERCSKKSSDCYFYINPRESGSNMCMRCKHDRRACSGVQQVQIKGKSKAKYDVSETKRDDGDYHLPNSASRYTRGPSMEPGPSSQSRRDPNTSTSAHHPPNRNAQRLHALVRLMDNFVRQEAQSESLRTAVQHARQAHVQRIEDNLPSIREVANAFSASDNLYSSLSHIRISHLHATTNQFLQAVPVDMQGDRRIVEIQRKLVRVLSRPPA